MFSKKKAQKQKTDSSPGGGGGKAMMEQMGIFTDTSQMDAMIYGDVENDEELEAELRALQGEDPSPKHKPKRGNLSQLDHMVAESMRDIPSDEELSDTEDPDLLDELKELESEEMYEPEEKKASSAAQNLSPVLSERLAMYQTAAANAKAAGDSSKARRLDRGIKTLQDLLKKAQCGREVDEDDIPPPVATSAKTTPVPTPTAEDRTLIDTSPAKPAAPQVSPRKPPPQMYEPTLSVEPKKPVNVTPEKPVADSYQAPASLSPDDVDIHKMLTSRRDKYKVAALRAKRDHKDNEAKEMIKTARQFDMVIKALENGQAVDLSKMPPPPKGFENDGPDTAAVRVVERHAASSPPQQPPPQAVVVEEEIPEMTQEDKSKLFNAPKAAGSVLGALEQRLEKYKSGADQAKAENNGSKARRMGRIVKQYEAAIKSHKAGKPVDYEELPTPPGFPPIPGVGSQGATSQASSAPAPAPAPVPSTPAAAAAAPPRESPKTNSSPADTKTTPPKTFNRQQSATSRAEQQTLFLQERQLAFKKAALQAKQNGDVELAKKYLRMAKGFDQMIEASTSGLPVNMSQVPPPPGSDNIEKTYEFVNSAKDGEVVGDRDEMYKKLEQDLIKQIRTCTTNAEHFTQLGDVSSAAKFDKLAAGTRRDLDAVKNAYKYGDPVPRFHYENKQFSLVQCCTELGDNDLELIIVRGINYGLPSGYKPSDLDTYVKFEFPYPSESPQAGTTDAQKHTNSPEYNQTFKLEINRKSRAILRLLKSSKTLKLEVYYKRGFLKGDKLLGTASVKLLPLESQCILHDSFDLMDGRKSIGGRLEIKIRVRDPFVTKQVEEVKEKWLIIDNFERSAKPTAASASASASKSSYTSMEVLKYEKQLLDKEIKNREGKLSKNESDALKHKSSLLQQQIDSQRDVLKRGGFAALKDYMNTIEKMIPAYHQEAVALVKQGNRPKAQTLLNKKKLVENEVESIRSKLPHS